MKVEFNKNGMRAEINSSSISTQNDAEFSPSFKMFGEQVPLILGIAAMLTATANLLFGLLIKVAMNTANSLMGEEPWHLITVFIIFSSILAAISVICGVISVVNYTKSSHKTSDGIGFTLSITSFVICIVGLIINVLSLFV